MEVPERLESLKKVAVVVEEAWELLLTLGLHLLEVEAEVEV